MPVEIGPGWSIGPGWTVSGAAPPPPPTDPNFNQVSLLLHGDGTDGSQNNTFLDASTNNFTVTRNGNTTQGTNTPFSQEAGYWSYCIVNNNTTSIATPDSSSFILSADFTVEMWLNNPSTAGYIPQVFNIGRGSNSDTPYGSNGIMLQFTGDGVYLNGSNLGINLQSYCNSGQWMHIALCRTGSTFKVFINGNQIYSSTFTAVVNSGGKNVLIGSNPALSSFGWTGYISNLRVVNGTGLYTSNFTPSTTPLTAVTNTVLLTGQSNYLKDNSSNNFAITAPTGTPSVQPFSPFAPTTAYSTGVNGGSMYFDGSSYLNTASSSVFNFGTGDFTIECWVYPTSSAVNTIYSDRPAGGIVLRLDLGSVINVFYSGGVASFSSTLTAPLNRWTHIAVTRTGSNAYIWVNGVNSGTSSSYGVSMPGNAPQIGTWQGGETFIGYISNLRVLTGTALYTTTFTPPTAPLTAITNTQLLLGGTNAGIFDNAAKNDLETVGTAQVSTAVTKFGTGSMSFDGTGDWLAFPPTPQLQFASGDFTIELWANFSVSTSGADYIFVIQGLSGFISNAGFAFLRHNSNKLRFIYTDDGTGSSGYKICNSTNDFLPTTNVWYHLAVTRNGNTFRLFIDGVQVGSSTLTTSIFNSTRQITIGADSNAAGAFNGYLDDLRITKGVARYTTNFTPPTEPFPDQ